ncbi:MAG: NUDIX hydrolase [Pseudomonadota bacterium]
MRRVGHSPDPDRKYVVRPGVYAILPRGNDVLLTAQVEDGIYDVQLPGGGIDPGEAPLRALHREVYEETGWHIAGPRRLGAFRRFVYMPEYDLWAEKVCTIYLARPVRRLGPPTEAFHHPLLLPGSEAIRALGNDGDRLFLERYVFGSN